jgi:hypothetical protein
MASTMAPLDTLSLSLASRSLGAGVNARRSFMSGPPPPTRRQRKNDKDEMMGVGAKSRVVTFIAVSEMFVYGAAMAAICYGIYTVIYDRYDDIKSTVGSNVTSVLSGDGVRYSESQAGRDLSLATDVSASQLDGHSEDDDDDNIAIVDDR